MADTGSLREAVATFCDEVERNAAHRRRPAKGLIVPFHGEFTNANPSTMRQLEWWARVFRSALNGGGT